MEKKTLKTIGDRLREQISLGETMLPKQMRRLLEHIEQAEQRERGRDHDELRKPKPS
jgi:hypothetical protein